MRHANVNRKFGRTKNQRKALLSSLARSLALRKRITTTEAKAKELRPYVEKLITTGKRGTLASRRLLVSRVGESAAARIMKLAPSYAERAGGYTRIVKLVRRRSDAAKMAIIELI